VQCQLQQHGHNSSRTASCRRRVPRRGHPAACVSPATRSSIFGIRRAAQRRRLCAASISGSSGAGLPACRRRLTRCSYARAMLGESHGPGRTYTCKSQRNLLTLVLLCLRWCAGRHSLRASQGYQMFSAPAQNYHAYAAPAAAAVPGAYSVSCSPAQCCSQNPGSRHQVKRDCHKHRSGGAMHRCSRAQTTLRCVQLCSCSAVKVRGPADILLRRPFSTH
jgi:hypothetical protein